MIPQDDRRVTLPEDVFLALRELKAHDEQNPLLKEIALDEKMMAIAVLRVYLKQQGYLKVESPKEG